MDPRYPIGKFEAKDSYSKEEIDLFIQRIETLPSRLEAETIHLSDQQLDTPYRDGGWTVRQVVHHLADSHSNAYIRIKWTLTEGVPTIKAYDEKLWAETPETKLAPGLSIALLKALHAKWTSLLRHLSNADFQRTFIHQATGKTNRLDQMTGMYAWHGDHHLAHITELKKRSNWS